MSTAFMQLTRGDGSLIFVRRDAAICVSIADDNGNARTTIALSNGGIAKVQESPERVLELVAGPPLQQLAEVAE